MYLRAARMDPLQVIAVLPMGGSSVPPEEQLRPGLHPAAGGGEAWWEGTRVWVGCTEYDEGCDRDEDTVSSGSRVVGLSDDSRGYAGKGG